jgi:hypothetical protein
MAFRARVKGWNHPSTTGPPEDGNPAPSEGPLPMIDRPQRFNLEVTDAGHPQGEEFFEFDVHSPETLQHLLEAREALLGRGIVVVVGEYAPERVAETMTPLVESVKGETWEEVAFRVGALGPWEFEGWKWHPAEEELRPDPGVEAEVRDVRLLRTAIGDSFSLPMEVRFGGKDLEEEITLSFLLQSPLWLRNNVVPGEVVPGSGRIFSLRPDADAIREALEEASPLARAPSWDLLRRTLRPLEAPST